MIQNPLTKEVKITVLEDLAAAGTTTLTGAILDMADFDSVVLMAQFAVANSGNYMYVEQGDTATLTDAANLAGTKIVPSANNELVITEITKPQDRYLRPYLVRGASSATGPVIAIQFNGKKLPIDNDVTSEVQVEEFISPAEGTM